METVKLIIANLISPLSIALVLQGIGWTFWLRKRSQGSQRGLALVGLGTLILVTGGLAGLTYERRRAAEFVYPPLELTSLPTDREVVAVVLGTGFNADPELPANSQVSGAFHARLLEGVRIYRSGANVRLFVSIAGRAEAAQKEEFMRNMVELLALDPARVTVYTEAMSTADEAEAVVEIVGTTSAIVIATSAGHMLRAVSIFESEGLQPVAAPADYAFVRAGSPNEKIWPRWIPSTDGINSSHQWLYESIAMLWHKISGR